MVWRLALRRGRSDFLVNDMKAFLLAAGLGERMRPLTLEKPKPLLEVAGKPLIVWHIDKLRAAGICDLIINSHWLADQMHDFLGDGSRFGVRINWSHEPRLLNTGGGLKAAQASLGNQPFALISGDVWTDCDYRQFFKMPLNEQSAHLLMVRNPDFRPQGDFSLCPDGLLHSKDAQYVSCTYSGIGILSPEWVRSWNHFGEIFPLIDPLRAAVAAGRISATLHSGKWTDVGTPERLQKLRKEVG
jgi:MurNAc alpha-1-phosphate uridylyltransferase